MSVFLVFGFYQEPFIVSKYPTSGRYLYYMSYQYNIPVSTCIWICTFKIITYRVMNYFANNLIQQLHVVIDDFTKINFYFISLLYNMENYIHIHLHIFKYILLNVYYKWNYLCYLWISKECITQYLLSKKRYWFQ